MSERCTNEAIYSDDGTTLLSAQVESSTFVVRDGCKVIARKAFMYQDALQTIELPNSLETIEPFAFACTSLEHFEAPAHLHTIGEKAFFQCRELRSVNLNVGLLEIGEDAFMNSAVKKLRIPASVCFLGRGIVSGTPLANSGNMHNFVIDSANTNYLFDGHGGIYKKGEDSLRLEEFFLVDEPNHDVLSGTIEIAPKAYLRALGIRKVQLPEGLVCIGAAAFAHCSTLEDVTIPETLKVIERDAFLHTALVTLNLPEGFEALGTGAVLTGTGNRATLHEINIHPGCKRYYVENDFLCERKPERGNHAILYFGQGSEVAVPQSVTVVDDFSFPCEHTIRELVLHKGIQQFGSLAIVPGTYVQTIVIELEEPVDGCKEARICFPTPPIGSNMYFDLFRQSNIDFDYMYLQSDHLAYFARDTFERCSIMVERLMNPLFLPDKTAELFRETLARTLKEACMAFALHGYMNGFDMLVELGLLNKEGIERMVGQMSEAGDAHATAYLLELKRKCFPATSMNDYFAI